MHPSAKLLSVVDHMAATGKLPLSMNEVLEVTLRDPTTFRRGLDLAGQIIDLYAEHIARKDDQFTHGEFVMALGILLVGATVVMLDLDANGETKKEGGAKSEK